MEATTLLGLLQDQQGLITVLVSMVKDLTDLGTPKNDNLYMKIPADRLRAGLEKSILEAYKPKAKAKPITKEEK